MTIESAIKKINRWERLVRGIPDKEETAARDIVALGFTLSETCSEEIRDLYGQYRDSGLAHEHIIAIIGQMIYKNPVILNGQAGNFHNRALSVYVEGTRLGIEGYTTNDPSLTISYRPIIPLSERAENLNIKVTSKRRGDKDE